MFVGSDDHHVYAVNAATGTRQWATELLDRVDASPAIVGSWDNNFYTLATDTGDESWSYKTGNSLDSAPSRGGKPSMWGITTLPSTLWRTRYRETAVVPRGSRPRAAPRTRKCSPPAVANRARQTVPTVAPTPPATPNPCSVRSEAAASTRSEFHRPLDRRSTAERVASVQRIDAQTRLPPAQSHSLIISPWTV